jgi:hypothetical protein
VRLEELNISEDCRMRLARVGIRETEDLPHFASAIRTGPEIRLGLKCWDEIIAILETMGFWTYSDDQTNLESSAK